jgi:prolyl 4-hydroxylase
MSVISEVLLWLTRFILLSSVTIVWHPGLVTSIKHDKPATCRNQPYKSHLLSEDPLVIYIESFISIDEASQLVDLR